MGQYEYLCCRIYVCIWLSSEALYALSTFKTVSPIVFKILDNDYNISTIKRVHKICSQKRKRLFANHVGLSLFEWAVLYLNHFCNIMSDSYG